MHVARIATSLSHEVKFQCIGSLDFIFYGIELNPAIQIIDKIP